MPSRGVVCRLAVDNEALERSRSEVCAGCSEGLPGYNGLPVYILVSIIQPKSSVTSKKYIPPRNITQHNPPSLRRQHIRPMILPARRRPYTHQLTHRRHHRRPARPAEQKSICETAGSAVQQAEDEDAEEALPCYDESGGEAEDGNGREVALEWEGLVWGRVWVGEGDGRGGRSFCLLLPVRVRRRRRLCRGCWRCWIGFLVLWLPCR